jgi:DNA-binding IclR family transcriptional regulator
MTSRQTGASHLRPSALTHEFLPAESPTKGAQSLHRAMHLLATVGEHNVTGIRLTELAQATGLHVATAHRLLGALVHEQMVAFDGRYTKRYFLGLRLHSLVDLARYSPLRARIRECLAAVAADTGDVAYLYVPLLNDMIMLERADVPRAARSLIVDVGRRLPMGVGAASIALLAALPLGRAREMVETNAPRYAEFPSLTMDAVWQSVEEARARGHGMTRQQVARGLIGLGIVILNGRGEPEAAITLVGTLKRMSPDHVAACVKAMRRHIDALGPIDLATRPV